jgi:polysaccharide export outer membrane protein
MTSAARLAVLLAALVPLGIARAQNRQPAAPPPTQPQPQVNEIPAGSAVAPNLPVGVDTSTYEIGALDILRVVVWREPNFTDNHAVRPDGKITIPLVGDIQAAGLTPERLGAQLKQALSDFIQSPEVTVSVLQVNSKRYTVTGLVLRPGPYSMPSPIRVFDALNLTGGFQQWADTKHIVIIRANSNERLEFNYQDFIKGKNTQQNVYLQNGDTVYVHD